VDEMGTEEKLNIFWNKSGFYEVGQNFKSISEFLTGTSEYQTAAQKKVVKGTWDKLADMPKKMDDYYIKSMVDILMTFG